MELSQEQVRAVESDTAMIGYLLANYKRFGNDALEVASDFSYEVGKLTGQKIKQKMGITGSDAHAVAAVLSASLVQSGLDPSAQVEGKSAVRVEGNKVIGENRGFCPWMAAINILKAPWETVCSTVSWRGMEGVAAAVNPNVTMEVPESRSRGDTRCLHVITVPE